MPNRASAGILLQALLSLFEFSRLRIINRFSRRENEVWRRPGGKDLSKLEKIFPIKEKILHVVVNDKFRSQK
jgi:hypothetical protein